MPYPRAFWPLNSQYEMREVTGRSPDLKDFSGGQITFNATGPYAGDANGKVLRVFSQTNYSLRLVIYLLKLVLLEWSESKSDGKFGLSMSKNPPV